VLTHYAGHRESATATPDLPDKQAERVALLELNHARYADVHVSGSKSPSSHDQAERSPNGYA